MSYFLLSTGPTHFVGVRSGLVKKQDRESFAEATLLLRRASEINDKAEKAVAAERRAGWAEGYAAGAAAAGGELKQALSSFSAAVSDIADAHSRSVVEAAYAATVAIIGQFDDSALVDRIVRQVIAQQKDIDGIHILVSPQVHAQLLASTNGEPVIPIVSDPDLGLTDCHVVTANGRIIASLPVQLAVLRERWGMTVEATTA
jgi:type III secretion protein L